MAIVSAPFLSRAFPQITLGALVILSAAACVAWGWTVLPIFMQRYNVQRIAPQVINGQSFDTTLLESILPPPAALKSADACQASLLNAAAIVRLRLFESATAHAERKLLSETMQSLREAVRSALTCSPTQPFPWFLQYWLEVSENGFSDIAVQYLRMSYVLGPNEGWISAKRNGFSLAIYDQLPKDIAAQVVPEFVSLVRSGFYTEAVSNLSGPGWSKREVLVAALAPIPESRRYEFAKYLRSEGIYLDIPGLVPIDWRPWN
jgi:hypothetical protein